MPDKDAFTVLGMAKATGYFNNLALADRILGRMRRAMVEAAGGTYVTKAVPDGPYPYGIEAGGVIIHELGTARMGANPKTSALNKYCQAHDVKNVFVTDAAAFVTNPDKNPTLTIMALSWRASEYLIDEAKKNQL